MGQVINLVTKQPIPQPLATIHSLMLNDDAISCKVDTCDLDAILRALTDYFDGSPALKLKYPNDWKEVVEDAGLPFFSVNTVLAHGLWRMDLRIDPSGIWFWMTGLG